ncbi:MAG: cation transporter, partial [Bacteroidaceae bacterium]|nr:cation transporter [Bacteroidaceae bacterium]
LLLYLTAIIGGSILFGFGIDYLLPREWFTEHLSSTHACCHDVAGWFDWLCTGILVLLLLNVVRMKLQHKSACSCGHAHGGHCHCHHEACSCGETAAPIVAETRTYVVKGMTCNHCRANTEKVIRTVEGVVSVSVDLSSGIATVTGSDLNDVAIREAVESIGFTLES